MLSGELVRIRTMEVEDLPQVKAINDDPRVRGSVVGWGWPTSRARNVRVACVESGRQHASMGGRGS